MNQIDSSKSSPFDTSECPREVDFPLSKREKARRANLTKQEKLAECKAARKAYDRHRDNQGAKIWYESYKSDKPSTSFRQGKSFMYSDSSEASDEEPQSTKSKSEPNPNPIPQPAPKPEPSYSDNFRRDRSAEPRGPEPKSKSEHKGEARKDHQREYARNHPRPRSYSTEARTRSERNHWNRLNESRRTDEALYSQDYDALHAQREAFHADHIQNPFPELPSYGCTRWDCQESDLLGVCHHDVEKTMRGSGRYGKSWLEKEKLRWHPDMYIGKSNGPEMAGEVFKMLIRLLEGPGHESE